MLNSYKSNHIILWKLMAHFGGLGQFYGTTKLSILLKHPGFFSDFSSHTENNYFSVQHWFKKCQNHSEHLKNSEVHSANFFHVFISLCNCDRSFCTMHTAFFRNAFDFEGWKNVLCMKKGKKEKSKFSICQKFKEKTVKCRSVQKGQVKAPHCICLFYTQMLSSAQMLIPLNYAKPTNKNSTKTTENLIKIWCTSKMDSWCFLYL